MRPRTEMAADRIVLAAGLWRATVAPRLGGSLLELSCAGEPILRPAAQDALAALGARATSCFPLVPYANRIAHGRLTLRGRTFQLQPNFPPEPHAVHGIGWQRSWEVTRAAECSVELTLRHDAGAPAAWPFAFEARAHFALGGDGLEVELSLTNRDIAPWPAGLGLHPYFPRWPDQTLRFEAAGAWRNGSDSLPAQRVAGPEWDFSAARPAAGLTLDNDFYGWRRRAWIAAGSARRICIEGSGIFSVLRVFTPAARGFIAVEPVSHIADAVNRPDAPGSGYRLLAPGGTLTGTVSIRQEAAA